ncbi:uncharacterized protein [Triticum aestivum]|uniref:uncharacterized protein n=1 Tax=Triticum aestivum TaxID=4565 RepID=UPI001D00C94D|nr:uncharacterized protein LOC123129543 [Triticum aestivum]
MAGSGFESFNSRSVDPKLIPRGPEKKMVVRLALRRSREDARARQRLDFFRRVSIASAQMTHRSGAWCPSTQTWCGVRAVRGKAREAATVALAAVDVGAVESHSPTPRMVHQSRRHNRVVVDVAGLSQDGSIIDRMYIGTTTERGCPNRVAPSRARSRADLEKLETRRRPCHCPEELAVAKMENSYELDSQINNSSFLDMMNVGSSDTNCYGTADCSPLAEQVTMPPQKGRKSAKPKSAKGASTKGKNWSTAEDLVLIQAWANTSLDAVTGTNQNLSTYWGRISDHYDAHKKPSWPGRGSNGLTCRYNVISTLTSKFCACIQHILNRNCSRMTLFDKERDAHRMYIELDEKKKPFTLMHCYIKFEKYPKWQTRPLPQKKQKKTSDASPGTTFNDEDFGTCTDALEEELRPPGTKHDKNERLRKGKTGLQNSKGSFHILSSRLLPLGKMFLLSCF